VKLGNPNGARALRGKQTGNKEAVAKIKEMAAQRAMTLKGIVEGIKGSGVTSVRAASVTLVLMQRWRTTRRIIWMKRMTNFGTATSS
jgi:hypothetical protein